MGWLRKKTATTVSDAPRGASLQEGKVVPTSPTQARLIGLPAAHQGELRTQNLDSSPGSWLVDAEEFKIPVRLQGIQRPYIIPRNYRITGDVTSARRVVVEGELAGGMLDVPTVTVTAGGCLRGCVKAANLQIAGLVDADVSVSEAIEVSGRGRLAGRIVAPEVKVWPGAVLHGAVLTVGEKTPQTGK